MSRSDRQAFIDSVQEFLKDERNWLHNTLDFLGLELQTLSHLAEESHKDDFVFCPIKSEHRMPPDSLETHLAKCENKYGTYPEVVDGDVDYASIQVDSLGLLFNVVGHHADSGSHDITNVGQDLISDTTKTNEQNEQPSTAKDLAELLKAERDAKRRRATHRGKRVHTNKKSYVEILRELIANQMVTLVDESVLENNDNVKANSKKEIEESPAKTTYLGVGQPYYPSNPYTRWMTIEQEEEDYLRNLKSNPDDRSRTNEALFVPKTDHSYNREVYERRRYSGDVRKYRPSHDIDSSRKNTRKSDSCEMEKAHSSRYPDYWSHDSRYGRSRDRSNRLNDSHRKEPHRSYEERLDDTAERESQREFTRSSKQTGDNYQGRITDSVRSRREVKSERNSEPREPCEISDDSSVSVKKENEMYSERVNVKSEPSSYRKRLISSSSTDSEKRYKKKKKHKKNKKHKNKKHKRRQSSSSSSS